MASLRLIPRDRNRPISDAETVRLGRLLTCELSVRHVGYPDDPSGPVVVIKDHGSVLTPQLAEKVELIIGEFDQVVEAG